MMFKAYNAFLMNLIWLPNDKSDDLIFWKVVKITRRLHKEIRKKKKANKQTRRTNKPGGTGIRQNQTNGVRNTQSKHQILSLQQIIFVHQVVKGLLRSKVNKI